MAQVLPEHATAARVAATCILLGPSIYSTLEWLASRGYYPSYSYFGNFTSDLAVPYPFVERNSGGRRVNSTRAWMQESNWYIKAVLFAIGHGALLRAQGKRDRLAVTRAVFVAIYSIGTVLIGLVPGGPREHENGKVVWHTLGGTMSLVGGNVSAILAGLADTDPFYRRAFVLLGSCGLFNIPIFVMKGKTNVKGLWQRSIIYAIQSFEFLTAYALWKQLARPEFQVAKLRS